MIGEWIHLVGPGELLAIGASLTFAVAQGFIRQGLRTGTPMMAALIINGGVSLVGLTLSLYRGSLLTAAPAALFWFAMCGVTGPGLGRITYLIGITRMGLGPSVTLSASTPLWATLTAIVVLGESPTVWVILGTLATVAGVVLLSSRGEGHGSFRRWFRGVLIFPLFSSVSYAFMPVFMKLAYLHQRAPELAMAVAFLVGGLTLLAARPLLPRGGEGPVRGKDFLFLCIGGFFNMLTALQLTLCFTMASVSTSLPLSRLAPLWVLVISYFFLGKLERITPRLVVATIMVVAGAVMITALR